MSPPPLWSESMGPQQRYMPGSAHAAAGAPAWEPEAGLSPSNSDYAVTEPALRDDVARHINSLAL